MDVKRFCQNMHAGGECEIRTHGCLSTSPVFKTGAFNRSANSPEVRILGGRGGPHGAGGEGLSCSIRIAYQNCIVFSRVTVMDPGTHLSA